MNRYQRLITELETTGRGTMKCFGNSMFPILPNPALCIYFKEKTYDVGDIVFCKVNGRFIDAHIITKVGNDGRYLIANNRGHENGWTRTIYGRVVAAKSSDGRPAYHASH
jgi:hypothetical protein